MAVSTGPSAPIISQVAQSGVQNRKTSRVDNICAICSMRYEDVQHIPRGLKILFFVIFLVATAVNVIVLFAVFSDPAHRPTSEDGWFTHWGWILPPPLLIAIVFALFMTSTMYVWVDDNEVRIRMRPFHIKDRRIAWSDVQSFTIRKANAFGEFGGWGIRWNPFNGKMGYIWGGTDALELTLTNGKRIVITVADGAKLRASLEGIPTAERGSSLQS